MSWRRRGARSRGVSIPPCRPRRLSFRPWHSARGLKRFFTRSSKTYTGEKWGIPAGLRFVPESFSLSHAESLPAVGLAVGAISQNVARLPATVYDVRGDTLTPAADDAETEIVTRSWGNHLPAQEGMEHFLRSVLLTGKGAVLVERDNMDRLAGLDPLDPARVHRYRISNEIRYQYMGTGALGDIPRDDLLFMPFREPLDRVTDVSPLAKHWPAIRAALAPTHFGAWYFDRGAQGNVVYSRKDDSNSHRADAETQKARNEALWRMEDRMRREGRRSAVAPDGYYPVQTGSNAQESELGGQRTFGVQEVARIYDVPATVLHDLSRGTYSQHGPDTAPVRRNAGTVGGAACKPRSTTFCGPAAPAA